MTWILSLLKCSKREQICALHILSFDKSIEFSCNTRLHSPLVLLTRISKAAVTAVSKFAVFLWLSRAKAELNLWSQLPAVALLLLLLQLLSQKHSILSHTHKLVCLCACLSELLAIAGLSLCFGATQSYWLCILLMLSKHFNLNILTLLISHYYYYNS